MEKLNKDTLRNMGFQEAPVSFGMETMQKGILKLQKRQDLHTWRMYVSTTWIDIKNAEVLHVLDKVYNT